MLSYRCKLDCQIKSKTKCLILDCIRYRVSVVLIGNQQNKKNESRLVSKIISSKLAKLAKDETKEIIPNYSSNIFGISLFPADIYILNTF